MVKILKKKFFPVYVPILGEDYEAIAGSLNELYNRTLKLDVTRKLKGKSVDLILRIIEKDGKAIAIPKKLVLLPFFIQHMLHGGISYVEDSFEAETKDSKVLIKPFLITRKKVSRAIRKTLRNSSKNWLIDYLKTKEDDELFTEILSNQLQKSLSIKLKKIYPLAICEIRIFEIKKPLEEGKLKLEEEKIKKLEEEIKEPKKDTKEVPLKFEVTKLKYEPDIEKIKEENKIEETKIKKPSKSKKEKKEKK